MKQKRYNSGWMLAASLTLTASIASPRPLLAISPSFWSGQNPRLSQSSGISGGQQGPSPRPRQSGNNGSGGEVHSRPPRNGSQPESPGSRPNPDQPRPGGPVGSPEVPDPRPSHPPAQGRPPIRPSPQPPTYHHPSYGRPRPAYGWGNNGWRLHQYFFGNGPRTYPARRRAFFAGEYFPLVYLPYLKPMPSQVLEYLPPVPPGYEVGYFDGYGLVYDPNTLIIISVIDLYRY